MKRLKRGCICRGYNHYIYLYNIENDNKNIIAEEFSHSADINNSYPIKHLLQLDKYLIAKYGYYHFDIYDIEQNMKLINENDYIIKEKNEWVLKPVKKLKYEIPFYYLHLEIKNDFILVSNRQGNSFIYQYENISI